MLAHYKKDTFLIGILCKTNQNSVHSTNFVTYLHQALKPCKWLFCFIRSCSKFIRNLHTAWVQSDTISNCNIVLFLNWSSLIQWNV